LEIPNLRGDSALSMLQPHLNSTWISSKVTDKIREMVQRQQRTNLIVRYSLDKRFRFWCMMATPFLAFYVAGLIFSSETLFIIKFFLLGCLYAASHAIGNFLFDEYLMSLLPLSVYLATKLWFYVTWFTYIAAVVPFLTTTIFLLASGILWYCFLKSWRGDPGIIRPTQDERFKVRIQLHNNNIKHMISFYSILFSLFFYCLAVWVKI
jgi:palmitoyltransferase ZDHHC13/17